MTLGWVKGSNTIRYLRERGDLRWRAIECVVVIHVLCFTCFLVCSLQHCGHLLGKGCPLGSHVCYVLLCFVTFPRGVLGQVWYLVALIPDAYPFTCFNHV